MVAASRSLFRLAVVETALDHFQVDCGKALKTLDFIFGAEPFKCRWYDMGKRARLLTNKRRPSPTEAHQSLAEILKWVGGATAILSLVFGVFQLVQTVATIR